MFTFNHEFLEEKKRKKTLSERYVGPNMYIMCAELGEIAHANTNVTMQKNTEYIYVLVKC